MLVERDADTDEGGLQSSGEALVRTVAAGGTVGQDTSQVAGLGLGNRDLHVFINGLRRYQFNFHCLHFLKLIIVLHDVGVIQFLAQPIGELSVWRYVVDIAEEALEHAGLSNAEA
jgi:hypothetical protein